MTNRIWTPVLITTAALLCAAPAFSADRYVSTAGNDTSGTGVIGNPYATVNKAVTMSAAGDSIHVAAGTYAFTTSPRITVNKSVSIYGAQSGVDARSRSGAGETIIDLGVTSSVTGVNITTGGVTLDGLKVQGTGTGQSMILGGVPGSGITVAYKDLVIRNCWVSGVQGQTNNGIHLQGSDSLVERNLIENCKNGLNGGTDRATVTQADDIRIKATIRENEFVGCRWTLGGYTDGALITKNLFRDSVYPAGSSNNAIQGEYFNTTVSDNVISNYTSGDGNSIGIFIHNSRAANRPNQTNVVYKNNSIVGCSVGVAVSPNQTLASQVIDFQYNNLSSNTVGTTNTQADPAGNPIDMRNCWWGSNSGPSGEGSGTGEVISAGVAYDPWIGQDTSSGASELEDDSVVNVSVSEGSTSASVDVTPNTGEGAGHTVSIALQTGVASQGYDGFYNGLALPGSLEVVTDMADGTYKATLRMSYEEADLAAVGIYREDGLVLMVWDAATALWVGAVEKNIDPTRSNKGVSAPTGVLGDYGVDTTNNEVWAVVDHASQYATGAKDATALPVSISAFGIE